MKTVKINLDNVNIIKETPEERKLRVNSAGSAMFTQVIPNKKKLDKKKQRQLSKKEIQNQLL